MCLKQDRIMPGDMQRACQWTMLHHSMRSQNGQMKKRSQVPSVAMKTFLFYKIVAAMALHQRVFVFY